jgi:hypothetical protein
MCGLVLLNTTTRTITWKMWYYYMAINTNSKEINQYKCNNINMASVSDTHVNPAESSSGSFHDISFVIEIMF